MLKHISQAVLTKLNQLDIFEVGKRLGARIDSHGYSLCIMHIERTPSLYFNRKNNCYHCFGCQRGGGVVSLVQNTYNLNFIEAANWLMREFGIFDDKTPIRIVPVKKSNHSVVINQVVDDYQPDCELLDWIIEVAGLSRKAKQFLFEERLYTQDSVEKCKVKSITNDRSFVNALIRKFGKERCLKSGIVQFNSKTNLFYTIFRSPCLLFPYYDAEGKIFTIQARNLDSSLKWKYMFPKGCPTFIFNLEAALLIDRTTPLYIAEGPTDCLAYLSEGKAAVGIPGAGAFKEEYVKYLKDKSLFMYADNDSAGVKLFLVADALLRKRGGSIIRYHLDIKYKDYSDYHVAKYK